MQLHMELTGFYCNSWPILTIKQNNTVVFEQPIINTYTLELTMDNKPFTFGMENKSFGNNNIWDTNVDENGNITADKYVVINQLSINDVNFEHQLLKIPYHSIEHGDTTVHDQAIRFNGYWEIDINGNPYNWIIDLNNTRTNEQRTTSYFSDYESHGNYSAHQQVIDKIQSTMNMK